jgi:hypothetical protein
MLRFAKTPIFAVRGFYELGFQNLGKLKLQGRSEMVLSWRVVRFVYNVG